MKGIGARKAGCRQEIVKKRNLRKSGEGSKNGVSQEGIFVKSTTGQGGITTWAKISERTGLLIKLRKKNRGECVGVPKTENK